MHSLSSAMRFEKKIGICALKVLHSANVVREEKLINQGVYELKDQQIKAK